MASSSFKVQAQFLALFARHALRSLGRNLSSVVHRWTYLPSPHPRTVTVVGGSFAGTYLAQRLAHTLPSGFRVVLVEKHSHFHFAYGFPRFAVVPGLEFKGFIPYDNLAKGAPRGIFKHIHGEVVDIGDSKIVLKDGTNLDYHYLAIATGAAQPPPARVDDPELREGIARLRGYQQRIQHAGRIAVIGGGAVGVELAAEIRQQYPDKRITLVHSRDQLLPRFAPKVHDCVANALERMNIELIFGERPVMAADAGMRVAETVLEFSSGLKSIYDLVIPCTGLRPRSELLLKHAPEDIASNGEILVKPTLQLSYNGENKFAFGDVARTGGPKQGRASIAQADIVLDNMLQLIKGQRRLKSYIPHPFEGTLLMTLGEMGQLMYIKAGENEILRLGGKSEKDMGAARQWKTLHAKMPLD